MTRSEAIEPRRSQVIRRSDTDIDAAFESVRPRLVRIAASLIGDAGAEDVVHDTYLVARRHAGDLRDTSARDAWLARICVNRCFRIRSRARRLRELLERFPVAAPTPARTSPLELRELIAALPPRERAVIVLHHGQGYSLLEVADLVGISHANARQIATRARARLLRAWQDAER